MTSSQAVGIVPLFINVQSEQDSQSIGVSKEERTAILENLTSYQNQWNSKPPKGLKVGDTEDTKQLYKLEFLEDVINSLQKKGLYSGCRRTSPNIPKDIDSFTSGLYLNNDGKVIEFLVQFIKNLGKDLSNFNLHQLVTQNDPFRVLEDALNNPSNIPPIINDNPFQHKLNNEMEQEEILPFLTTVKRLRGRHHKIPIVNKPPLKLVAINRRDAEENLTKFLEKAAKVLYVNSGDALIVKNSNMMFEALEC
ncbi:hypothetical protein ACTFIT_009771 [Dictyostelium discoideum]